MSTTTTTETTTKRRMSSSGSLPLMAPKDATTANSMSLSQPSPNATPGPSSASTISTLRSLYPRAAHALLQRDFSLTQVLLESAFEILSPPLGVFSAPDTLDMHRRKWEILRITLETSAFVSPPSGKHLGADDILPPSLRANLMLSGAGLITALHSHAVRFFTPKQQNPKAAFLPAQVLVPLVLSSIKLECPDVGRSMTEDWLAQRDSVESTRTDAEGYERVLELYCLHILPRLHDWEYAEEFLEYEKELPEKARQHFISTLQTLRTREIETARTIPSPPPFSSPSLSSTSTRTPSPSPSVGSGSSSDTDDTHSTRTVVPNTPRAKHGLNGISPLTPTPAASPASPADSKRANGHAGPGKRPASPASTVHAGPSHSSRNPDPQHGIVGARTPHPTMTLVTSAVRALLAQLGPSQILFALLCILLPLFSFLLRLRRRKQQQTVGTPGTGIDAVRRKLIGQPRGGALRLMWAELVRAVGDAVRMAGGGLV